MNAEIENYLGNDVIDLDGTSFGALECVWHDEHGDHAFLGIKTAADPTHTAVVPAAVAEIDQDHSCLRILTHRDLVQHGPSLPCDAALSEDFQSGVHDYYGTPQPVAIRRGVLRKKIRPPTISCSTG